MGPAEHKCDIRHKLCNYSSDRPHYRQILVWQLRLSSVLFLYGAQRALNFLKLLEQSFLMNLYLLRSWRLRMWIASPVLFLNVSLQIKQVRQVSHEQEWECCSAIFSAFVSRRLVAPVGSSPLCELPENRAPFCLMTTWCSLTPSELHQSTWYRNAKVAHSLSRGAVYFDDIVVAFGFRFVYFRFCQSDSSRSNKDSKNGGNQRRFLPSWYNFSRLWRVIPGRMTWTDDLVIL